MEILAENVEWGPYVVFIVLSAIFLAVSVLAWISVSVHGGKTFEKVFSGIMAVLSLTILIMFIQEDPLVSYDAIVTDYNEVYENGYEVIEQNGDITTLRKVVDE